MSFEQRYYVIRLYKEIIFIGHKAFPYVNMYIFAYW